MSPGIFRAKTLGPGAILFSLLLGAVALSGCGDGLHEFLNPYQLPVRGLTALPAGESNQSVSSRYRWTLNVGLLNDSELPEFSVADVKPLLDQVRDRLKPLLPGIDVRFIIDQPMNSVFLIERSVRKKGFLGPKYDSDGPVLLLAPGPANADRNRARLSDFRYGPEFRALGIASVEQELASIDRLQQSGCLSEKLPASEYVWRAYLAGQVRYDLVLTNALVYPDDVRQRVPGAEPALRYLKGAPGESQGLFVQSMLVPMPGRSALEGYGAMVSLQGNALSCAENPDFRGDAAPATGPQQIDELVRVLFELLRPARISSGAADAKPAGYLQSCGPACAHAWERRLVALDSMIGLESGGGAEMCARLDQHFDEPAGVAPARQATARDILNRFHRLCGSAEKTDDSP